MTLQGLVFEAADPPRFPFLHLVEEVHDRVLAGYAEAIATLRVAATGAGSDEAQATLAGAADLLRAQAETHRVLLPPASDGVLDLGEHIGRLCAAFAKASLAHRGVRIVVETDDVWISADRCWRVGLVVAEFLRNAACNALAKGEGSILVSITREAGRVSCLVFDNGRAPPAARSGRGLGLARAIAAELGGTVRLRSTSRGSLAYLDFPASAPPASGRA